MNGVHDTKQVYVWTQLSLAIAGRYTHNLKPELWGRITCVMALLPVLIGVGILFWSGRSLVGWLLTISGALFIFAGVIANLHIYFQPASLFNTPVMLILFMGGLGLMARALRPYSGHDVE